MYTILEYFGIVIFNPLDTGFVFLFFSRKSVLLAALRVNNMDELIFMKFSRKFGHERSYELEYFRCCGYPLGCRVDFLFRGSVIVGNIMKERVNRLS